MEISWTRRDPVDTNQCEFEQEQQTPKRNVSQKGIIYHTRRGANPKPRCWPCVYCGEDHKAAEMFKGDRHFQPQTDSPQQTFMFQLHHRKPSRCLLSQQIYLSTMPQTSPHVTIMTLINLNNLKYPTKIHLCSQPNQNHLLRDLLSFSGCWDKWKQIAHWSKVSVLLV